VQFLTRRRDPDTETWWANALAVEDAPPIVRDLMREREVLASEAEIAEALEWARTVDGWDDEHPALTVVDRLP
jgi:hypothetical protein